MFLRMMANQARHKWAVTLLIWFGVTALVTLYVYLDNSARFTNRSMQLIMKRMGHNLLVLPAEADPMDTYLCTDRQPLFSDAVTEEMARKRRLPLRYFASVLQERVQVPGGAVVLTGIAPVSRGDETAEKDHLVEVLPAGTARLGSEAARLLAASVGGEIEVLNRRFQVRAVEDSLGSLDDFRVYVPLTEGQRLLNRPGKINLILTFLCLEGVRPGGEGFEHQFARLFPDFQIITRTPMARGRYLARETTEKYLSRFLLLVAAVVVAVIAVTGVQEVAERQHEIGILLAMGANYGYLIALYLAKLLVIAVAASVAGFVVGSLLSQRLLAQVLVVHTRQIGIVWRDLPPVVGMTCLVAMIASVLPMIKLVRTDPNAILVKE
jgi:ABC-type lipoprotein release transport system permease subunit